MPEKTIYTQAGYGPFLTLVISILLGVVGQLCLKIGATQLNFDNIKALLSNPYLWAGATVYFLSLIFYILSLRNIPLNIAFPSVSLSYILVIFLSSFFLKESITITQLMGSAAIIGGVFLLWI